MIVVNITGLPIFVVQKIFSIPSYCLAVMKIKHNCKGLFCHQVCPTASVGQCRVITISDGIQHHCLSFLDQGYRSKMKEGKYFPFCYFSSSWLADTDSKCCDMLEVAESLVPVSELCYQITTTKIQTGTIWLFIISRDLPESYEEGSFFFCHP